MAKIEGSVDLLKEISEILTEYAEIKGIEYPNMVSDVIFSINIDYQTKHCLGENEWCFAYDHEFTIDMDRDMVREAIKVTKG